MESVELIFSWKDVAHAHALRREKMAKISHLFDNFLSFAPLGNAFSPLDASTHKHTHNLVLPQPPQACGKWGKNKYVD